MKRLVIAIDCDDVLVPATEFLVQSYNSQYGTAVKLEDAHLSGNSQWMAPREEVFSRLHSIQMTPEYAAIAPTIQAQQAVKRLSERHELHLVTARNQLVMDVTMQMLETYYSECFVSVEHVGADKPKGDVCKAVAADVMIDDNVQHLISAQECGVEHLLWFGSYSWQRIDDEAPAGAVKCADWEQVEAEIGRIADR